MIEHVYRRAAQARSIDAVVVATDDSRIAETVERFGGIACFTSPNHQSGTDRLAEVAAAVPCQLLVNVQGDEPLLDPSVIDEAVGPLLSNPDIGMGTAARQLDDPSEWQNPNMVKVVCDQRGDALYFSRAAIPHGRDGVPDARTRIHVGLYVYRRATLLTLAALPQGPLERIESLEQLRALEHGIRIRVVDTPYRSCEVNTPSDLARVRQLVVGVRPDAMSTTAGEQLR